ncbi:hypothetical protein TNCT_35451 [Trichonephila clavata]|uniref:Uncharacterized protein n=1 Tax=Trichonephila clavata TaxID=2740835 RepID=A0A8X6IPD9_TRICU|nr:hypothetical protein TNCT_35451 [Trichonephila clavata]
MYTNLPISEYQSFSQIQRHLALKAILHGGLQITNTIHNQLKEVTELYKTCIIQRLVSHVDIPENENADRQMQSAWCLNTTLFPEFSILDINTLAKYKLRKINVHLPINVPHHRAITKTIVRLSTGYHRSMKINRDRTKRSKLIFSFRADKVHIFSCPTILATLYDIDLPFGTDLNFNEDNIEELTRVVSRTHVKFKYIRNTP